MKSKSLSRLLLPVAVFISAAFYLTCSHPDLLETSNHAWLFGEYLLSGRVGNFYELVAAHESSLYYLNNAHYNMVCYLLYALWQLPLRLVWAVTRLPMNEYLLMMWSKGLSVLAFLLCAVLTGKLAHELGLSESDTRTASLAILLNPVSFFAVFLMGQYDSLCLVFLLAGLLCWCRGKMWKCSLWMGIAMTFKFFPLLLLLPLLVLKEKRLPRCLCYLIASFWLMIPTSLLYRGRTGDMGVFNHMMIDRMFTAAFPGGLDVVPAFFLLYALLLMGCYLYRPAEDVRMLAPWVGLAVFGLLFLLVYWHPQWLILLVPFSVLTTLQQRQHSPWLALDAVFFAGFWVCSNLHFPAQLESNLFQLGIFREPVLAAIGTGSHNDLTFYLHLIPYLTELSPVLFAAPLLAGIFFKLPIQGRSLADRLDQPEESTPFPCWPCDRVMLVFVFVACILILWLGSALFVLLKSFG